MRKILIITRHGIAALGVACRRARLVAFGASLAVTCCCYSDAAAQTPAENVAPAAARSAQGAPVTGRPLKRTLEGAATQASYSIMSDTTRIEPAAYLGGGFLNPAATSYHAPDPCNPGCDVAWYGNYDALWLRREGDEHFTLSRNTFLPDFEYDFGGRYTVGRLLDCVNGWEGVYTGPFEWERQRAILGASNLQSQLVPSGGYTAAEISAFNNADQHVQAWRSQLSSFELNRRWWTWDVLSTMIGVRYVDYSEEYLFISDRGGVGIGTLRENVNNRMAGAQIGGDIFYPVSLRANLGFRGKAGVFANFDERSTLLQNAGTTVLNAGDSSVDVSGLIEMGMFGHYHVVPSVRLTAGYEFWYLPGMATVPEQRPFQINPSSGTTVFNDENLFLHGGSVGLQIVF